MIKMNSIIRLDTRGRLVIPNEFRETLDLKEGDNILLSFDAKNNTISISPVYGENSYLVKMEIEFKDKPGSLAKVATKLAELKVDLIMTESKSFERGKKARWDIIADISKLTLSAQEIRNDLVNTGFVEDASIKQIARDVKL
jgi:AbrB family looped-hinge helix DNA binding protein